MLGVAQTGARAGGGLGHQPIPGAQTSVLNVAMNHVTSALGRVTDHVKIKFLVIYSFI